MTRQQANLSVGGLAITDDMDEWADLPAHELRDTIRDLANEVARLTLLAGNRQDIIEGQAAVIAGGVA